MAGPIRPLDACTLYGILDLGYVPRDRVLHMTQDLIAGGVDLLQLRAKHLPLAEVEALAREMLPIAQDAGVPLIINDHPGSAAAVGTHGVHVGQDDAPITEVRRQVGAASCIIGKSTHSVAQARAAILEGADYIGFGPLYATGTKPDYAPIGLADIAAVHRFATVPVFCIGGVNLERLDAILQAGARRVVIVSALLLAADVAGYARAVKERLRACKDGSVDTTSFE